MENQILAALKNNKLFRELRINDETLRNIRGTLITAGEGEILFGSGDPAKHIYLIVSGEINLLKKFPGAKTRSLIFAENEFFGHDEYFGYESRSTTAVALRDTYLIALGKNDIDLLQNNVDGFEELFLPSFPAGDNAGKVKRPAAGQDDSVNTGQTFEEGLKTPYGDPAADNAEEDTQNAANDETPHSTYEKLNDEYADEETSVDPAGETPAEDTKPDEIPPQAEDPATDIERPKETSHKTAVAKFEESVEMKLNKELENFESPDDYEVSDDETIYKPGIDIPSIEHIRGDTKSFKMLEDEEFKRIKDLEDEPDEERNYDETIHDSYGQAENQESDESLPDQDAAGISSGEDSVAPGDGQSPLDDLSLQEPYSEGFDSDEEMIKKEDLGEEPETEINEEEVNEKENVEEETGFSGAGTKEAETSLPDTGPAAGEQESISTQNETAAEHFAETENTQYTSEKEEPETENTVENKESLPKKISDAEERKSTEKEWILELFSTLDYDAVKNTIINAVINLTGAERGMYYKIDSENETIEYSVLKEKEIKTVKFKLGEGITGWTAQQNEIVNLANPEEDVRFNPQYDRYHPYVLTNMLCVPVKDENNAAVGLIQLQNTTGDKFTEDEVRVVENFTEFAFTAVKVSTLYENMIKDERRAALRKMANFLNQDIKKPILVSKRYSDHLKEKELPDDVTQVLDMLLDQLNLVSDIVQSTSNFSEGKSVLRSVNTNLNELLDSYSGKVENYIKSRNCQIIKEFDRETSVKIDKREFFQCFNHLVRNACEAMPEGGNILISTKRKDKTVDVVIKDGGNGIDAQIKSRIFEPFFSYGKPDGTGLGLALTKRIVEDHGGKIKLISEPGTGTEFIITLPLSSAF